MEADKLARNYPLAVVAGLGRMTVTQGTQFGPYRILEQIGSGGMGDVYRVQDTRLGPAVAIKLISERYLAEAFGSGSPSPAVGRRHASHTRYPVAPAVPARGARRKQPAP